MVNLLISAFMEIKVSDALPEFDHKVIASCSNDIFEVLRQKKKLNHQTLQTMCSTSRFQINKIDLMGNKVELQDLELCSNQNLVSFRLGDIDYFPSKQFLLKHFNTFFFRYEQNSSG